MAKSTANPYSEALSRPAEKPEVIEHPEHYTQGGVECIDALRSALGDGFTDYALGNVMKYIWRWRKKGGVEDLEKARVYLGWAIKKEKGL